MKKPLHIASSVLLAVFFFFAGAGYNLVTYCCSSCEHAGVSKAAACCCECGNQNKQHNECGMQPEKKTDVCKQMERHKKSCEFKRLTLEVPTLQDFKFDFNNAHFPLIFHFIIADKLDVQSNTNSSYFFNPPNFSPLSSGREILAHHSILLI